MWGLYKTQPSFVLGFHGCDEETGRAVIAGERDLKPSENAYDWLGNGVYFWEGSPQRAWEWAQSVHKRRPQFLKSPFVVGAVIDLGQCFNLTDLGAAAELRMAFDLYKAAIQKEGLSMPENKGGTRDRLLRYLDRAVIEFMHQMRAQAPGQGGKPLAPYDTARAPFLEGDDLYPGAGLKAASHIQIAVRNPDCIKGYFLPRKS
ncbi:MAG: hypothetical protein J0L58_12710 [Burkholderiales bacterium]|nr:hypothetical protein [Burkholderiales bacterium]